MYLSQPPTIERVETKVVSPIADDPLIHLNKFSLKIHLDLKAPKKSPKIIKKRLPHVVKNFPTVQNEKPNMDIVDIINIYKPDKKSSYDSNIQNKMKIFRMMKFLKKQEAIIMKSNMIKSEYKRGKMIP